MKIRSAYQARARHLPGAAQDDLHLGAAPHARRAPWWCRGAPNSRALCPTREVPPLVPAQFIIFKITDDKKFIEIEKKGAKGASFDEFTKELPDGNCRYGVLDVEIQTKSGATANKLIFVSWYRIRVLTSTLFERTPHGATPNDGPLPSRLAIGRSDDNASIKPKMLYASSKDALKKSLTGINEEYQATDRGDLVLSDIQKKAGSV